MELKRLVEKARELRTSDVHLIVNCPPMLRIDGNLQPLADFPVLKSDDIVSMFNEISSSEQQEQFQKKSELDFAYSISDGWRIRCNAYKQQGVTSMAIRLLPSNIPNVDDLGLPNVCKELITRPRGLVIITGPTGSGKSTSLAAMIQYLNNTERRHIVTIEDPVEYIHPNIKCAVSQRELAVDTDSFASALKYVLRQDPDVILVGEMRDSETASAVLTVAETGHLVLSTGHAPSAAQSVERIVDLFPPHERPMAQTRLASVLLGVLCQVLVPRAKQGRIAAIEIMLANPAIKNLIREGKIHLIPNTIRTHSQAGMQMLDEALVKLYQKGTITWESVMAFCQDKAEVEKLTTGKIPH